MPSCSFQGVTLARILRPRGRRGEVAAEVLTDFPDRLTSLREAYLWDGKVEARRVGIRSCWLDKFHGGQAIFHFEGVESISEAERLRGLEVQVPLAERAPLPAGRYYVTDLAGCEVFVSPAAANATSASSPGAPEATWVGVVREVQFIGEEVAGVPLLVVDRPQGELLVPLAEEICTRIDVAARRIEVILPEGLRELNRKTRTPAPK